ncbi:MAG: deoxyribodipyrimidine photo-lyase [Rhodospirillaceae bacterium]|nr:deoxyribodipyrimidine photo-lyase [Rhodospirillaceae bacterium]
MADAPVIVWFRQDLRLADNPALAAALATGAPIVPAFILEYGDSAWALGGASRWWLHRSLDALDAALRQRGSRLVLRTGRADDALPALLHETGAGTVFWNRCYEPAAIARDTRIKAMLHEASIEAKSFNAALLHEPWTVKTQQSEPYKVFTPFWRTLRVLTKEKPLGQPPKTLPDPASWPRSDILADWSLEPAKPDWAGGLRAVWQPGEAGAQARLRAFIDTALVDYRECRDRPDRIGTSRLSPHLHFGEIGPRQIWQAIVGRTEFATNGGNEASKPIDAAAEAFLRELGWREFTHHLLYHWPELPARAWKANFDEFPWHDDAKSLAAWQRGLTGYPIVDAGMRELWQTGWMHNRVRMIVASFLIKDLLIDWRTGEKWFWDTLVDADLAQNAASWQWVAGSGADAAPYFRIFNPVLQGRKFDPDGAYVRQFVPELAHLSTAHIHAPWEAPEPVLAGAGLRLGTTYPRPIVDHKRARERALEAYQSIKAGA